MKVFRHMPLVLLLLVFCPLSLAAQVTKPTGRIKVCKVAGFGVPVGTPVHFTVGSTPLTVLAGPAPGGYCTVGSSSLIGLVFTVTETIPAGDFVSSIAVDPPGQLMSSNLTTGTASIKVTNGVTEVIYTDRKKMDLNTTGFLEICKQGHVKGNFTFTVNPGNLGPFVIPAGACSPPIEVFAGPVSITETPVFATALINCTTIPSTRQGPCNTGTLTSTVTVVPGNVPNQTIAILTNGPIIPPPQPGSKPR